jgi:hypothetical protein
MNVAVLAQRRPVNDFVHGLPACHEFFAVQTAHFQATPKALRRGITPTITLSTHRAFHRAARHLPAEKIQNHGQVEPTLVGRDTGNCPASTFLSGLRPQFSSVYFGMSSILAVTAVSYPPLTSLTAFNLNSSVYRARGFDSLISIS